MNYSVRILKRAAQDLHDIQRYLAESPATAAHLVDHLLNAAQSLSERPSRGARPRDARLRESDYRYLVVRPYLIFYKVLRRTVRVYRIIHAKRAYRDWL